MFVKKYRDLKQKIINFWQITFSEGLDDFKLRHYVIILLEKDVTCIVVGAGVKTHLAAQISMTRHNVVS
jgi:hypothetical protein